MITLNAFNGTKGDVTSTFSAIAAGAVFNPANPRFGIGITVKLVTGSTVTGRLEGSNDGVGWDTLQGADTVVSTLGTTKITQVNPVVFPFVRFNVTAITGTALVLISFDTNY
jgi:hypothetical protein